MSDMQWNPLSKPPKHEEQILLHLEYSDGSRGVQQSRGQYVHLYDGSFEDRGQVIGWMPMEPILNAPMGYDPKFGDDRLCLCGHSYYRHFDSYDNHRPVGCKYCHYDIEGVEYRKATRVPEGVDVTRFTYKDWAPFASVCSGFKWDGVEV